ncbi:MAG: FtsX-like permease family protein [Luteitalea sp.]|nr:FtsX-like permease family protein [Luteitalea sp.]
MNWIRRILGRRRLYNELSEEMRQHLEEKVDGLVEQGMSREEATMMARREFGNITSLEERGREVWQWPTLESILLDIRYALRQLRRQPSFTLVAVLILGLGIGANVAVFSVIDKLLFEPLPFRAPDRLVWIINQDTPGLSGRTSTVSTYEALTGMRSFEEMSTYEAFFARSSYKLAGDANPDRVVGVMIPANFFPFLGVAPMLGRTFTEAESQLNGPGAVILSHALWERRYSSDPRVIGRTVVVNDRAATIVGVMPRAFDFGAVFAPGIQVEIYMPVVFDVVRDWGNTMAILGRLEPGVPLAAAQAEAAAVIERHRREHPEIGEANAILEPLRESVTGRMRQPMLTLWAAVGLVLLIVCVNLANLLLARAASRHKEMALRGALGAGHGRLVRQLLTESVVLSILGGGLGVVFSYVAVGYVRQLEGLSIPLLRGVEINGVALGVAVGVTVLTALLFGLVPALAAARGDVGAALKEGGRGSSEGRDHRFVRSLLVVSEVALACVLLVGAGLFLRSFLHVLDVDLGFAPERTYALRVDAGENIDTEEKFLAYMRGLVSAARDVPGIAAASITDAVPLDSNRTWGVRAQGQPPEETVGALVKIIGPGLFETMQTPLVAGREFRDSDDTSHQPVAIVNETLAKQLWPNGDPLREALQVGNDERQVVGVVADVRHLTVEESAGPEFYLPILQRGTMSPSLVVRTGRSFADVVPALRAALAQVGPDLPTAGFRSLEGIVDRALSPRRFFVNVLTAFAATALLLAAIGIYGVISYSVARRTPEIGIRMALGASRRNIRASVVADTLRLTLLGAAIGLVGAITLSSLLSSILFAVTPSDPWTYAGTAAILLLVAVAAGFIPAFRASRVSPMAALRTE